jgi:hypothetical protein
MLCIILTISGELVYALHEKRFTGMQGKTRHVVAKWLAHLPFTSKVAGPNLSENSSMRFEPGPHVRRVKVNALSKVVGFLRVVRFPPTGKVDRVG